MVIHCKGLFKSQLKQDIYLHLSVIQSLCHHLKVSNLILIHNHVPLSESGSWRCRLGCWEICHRGEGYGSVLWSADSEWQDPSPVSLCVTGPPYLSLALTLWPLTPPTRSFSCHPDLPWNQRAPWEMGSMPTSNSRNPCIIVQVFQFIKETVRFCQRPQQEPNWNLCGKHVRYSWALKYNEKTDCMKRFWSTKTSMSFTMHSNIYYSKWSPRTLCFRPDEWFIVLPKMEAKHSSSFCFIHISPAQVHEGECSNMHEVK